MTDKQIRLEIIVDDEVLESWDLSKWDLDRPMSWAAIISGIEHVMKYAKEDLDDPS